MDKNNKQKWLLRIDLVATIIFAFGAIFWAWNNYKIAKTAQIYDQAVQEFILYLDQSKAEIQHRVDQMKDEVPLR